MVVLGNNNVRCKSSLHVNVVIVQVIFHVSTALHFIKGENTHHAIKANNACHISFPLSQLVRSAAALFQAARHKEPCQNSDSLLQAWLLGFTLTWKTITLYTVEEMNSQR